MFGMCVYYGDAIIKTDIVIVSTVKVETFSACLEQSWGNKNHCVVKTLCAVNYHTCLPCTI